MIDELEDLIRAKELVVLKKSESKKRGYTRVDKLDPANKAGTKQSHNCTLILVEGLSAKTYAVEGIERGVFGRTGRDWHGIYALRGKVLNTRNAKPVTIAKNNVISDIIKSLGLRHGVDYHKDIEYKKLRYGRVLILTDQDCDGLHISALIQNMFHSLFPSLLERDPPFLTSMQTPIVRVFNGRGRNKDLIFYDEREYHRYKEQEKKKNPKKKIECKYYKGLGASTSADIAETFGVKMVEFVPDEHILETMNKAFSNKHTDQRKVWLEQYNPENTILNWTGDKEELRQITCTDFIDTELIKFSIADCQRSIPWLMDGFKISQRKVLYVTFLRNINHKRKVGIKIAQLAASVAEKSAYHHGENNLVGTIVGLAWAFVGSNNIPLLTRGGGLGTRLAGGKDAAQPRYIYTKLDALTRTIYRPEDDALLSYLEEDGMKIEPRFYLPIFPMILCNGSLGIGTGWSSTIPCYNPKDLVNAVKIWLKHDGKVIQRARKLQYYDLRIT